MDARRRCRSKNTGLGMLAACFTVASSAGLSSSTSNRITAPSRARITAAGAGLIRDEVAAARRVTLLPTVTAPARPASRATSPGVIRERLDR